MPPARLRPPARHRRPAPRHRRNGRRGPVAAGLALVLIVVTTTAMAASPPPRRADEPSVVAARVPATGSGGGVSGPAGAWERPVRGPAAESATGTVEAGKVWVNYTFDGGPSTLLDTSGHNRLSAQGAAGGRLEFVAHGVGRAVKFPARCDNLSSPLCPRAVLEGPTGLNPGTRPLRFGASVLIAPSETALGSNVLQKGYSVGGTSQFKLQVDGTAGRPSCVLASLVRIYRVTAPVTVADRRWHRLGCARTGNRLSITVDGVARGTVAVPESLSIVNNHPLRIGGKNVLPNNDQFAGQIDDAYIAID